MDVLSVYSDGVWCKLICTARAVLTKIVLLDLICMICSMKYRIFFKRHFISLLAAAILVFSHVPSGRGDSKPVDESCRSVIRNLFRVNRNFWIYQNDFLPEFLEDVMKLRANDIILDGGAGEALMLQEYLYEDYLWPHYGDPEWVNPPLEPRILLPPKKNRAFGIALAYKKPTGLKYNRSRLNYIEGDVSDLLVRHPEIEGKVTLIADEYGIIKYYDLDKALEIYFRLLKKHGKIHFNFPDVTILKDGKEISFVNYLSQIKGARLKFVPNPNYSEASQAKLAERTGKYSLEKTSHDFIIPRLREVSHHMDDGGRNTTYEMINP
jgi:hypothetical protein